MRGGDAGGGAEAECANAGWIGRKQDHKKRITFGDDDGAAAAEATADEAVARVQRAGGTRLTVYGAAVSGVGVDQECVVGQAREDEKNNRRRSGSV